MAELKFEDEILIPKARIAILIGIKGAVRKAIERKGKCRLKIDKAGLVKITSKDAFNLMIARNVVEAVGRGFNPEIAQNLFKEDNGYELLNMFDYGARKKSDIKRMSGLIIGKAGTARKVIEQITGTHVSVYGKTVAIIGSHENLQKARTAVERLLTGARHASVFKFLERTGKRAEQFQSSSHKVKYG